MDTYPPAVQRPALLAFAAALGSADNALCLDECRDPQIKGRFGHVYAVPGTFQSPTTPGFQFFVSTAPDGFDGIFQTGSKNGWTRAKKALAFATLVNDGDDEGSFFMARPPTKSEAETIRAYLGVHKRPAITQERRDDLKERGRILGNFRLAA